MRIQWIALAIVLSTPVVGAQATSYDGYSYSPIPGSSGGGARTTVTGDFDGDRLPDIAVLRGTEAWLIFGPDVYGAATRYKPEKGSPPIASAIATLAGSPRDELLIAHKFGLSAWTRTRASSFSERAIAGADWANARALAVSPIDNTVYGLDASGTRLGVWTQATGSSWSSLPFIGTKLTIVDWESDGDDELAIASADGVAICSDTGTIVWDFPAPYGVADVVALRDGAGVNHRVSFVGKGPGGDLDWIATVGDGVVASFTILGDLDVVGLAAGDVDGDGDDDLALSHQAGTSLLLLYNSGTSGGSTPVFSAADSEVVSFGIQSTPPIAGHAPVFADTDQDGDLDLIQIVNSAHTVCVVHQNATVGAADQMPNVMEVAYLPDETAQEGHLCVEVKAPLAGVPTSASHLELVVWEMPDPLGAGETLSIPFDHQFEVPRLGESHFLSVKIPDPTPHTLGSIFFWGVRYVDGAPSPTAGESIYAQVFPLALHGFTTEVGDPLGGSPQSRVQLIAGASGVTDPITVTTTPDSPPYYHLTAPTGPDRGNTGSNTLIKPTPGSRPIPNPGT